MGSQSFPDQLLAESDLPEAVECAIVLHILDQVDLSLDREVCPRIFTILFTPCLIYFHLVEIHVQS